MKPRKPDRVFDDANERRKARRHAWSSCITSKPGDWAKAKLRGFPLSSGGDAQAGP
jgi:hypothetical protein